jgi:hypothetical protein
MSTQEPGGREYEAIVRFADETRPDALYFHGEQELSEQLAQLRSRLLAGSVEEVRVTGPGGEVVFDSTAQEG